MDDKDKLDMLEKAGLISNVQALTSEQAKTLASLSLDEIKTLIAVKHKLQIAKTPQNATLNIDYF